MATNDVTAFKTVASIKKTEIFVSVSPGNLPICFSNC